MHRESRQLKEKAIESVISAVEFFNRPQDQGRVVAVLFFLQHAFEMLLKAAINEDRGTVFPPGENKSYSFDKCCGICRSDMVIITEDEARLLDVLNNLRDGATHHLIEFSEAALYSYAQGAIDLFERLLSDVFDDTLANHLPDRVLPLSTVPPKDIQMILSDEMEIITGLIAPGRRQGHQVRPMLRHLLIVDATVRDQDVDASDGRVDQAVSDLRDADDWRAVLPGAAALSADPDADGPTISVRIERQGEIAARYIAEDEDPDVALAIRRVSELQTYCFGARKLAEKLPISEQKMLALIEHLGLQHDDACFRVITIDGSSFKRYSVKALQRLREAAQDEELLETAWAQYVSRRR